MMFKKALQNIMIGSILLLVLSAYAEAQTYGNEWINYNQDYYRFSIAKTGMYRVTKEELQSAGVPLASINSLVNIQLFYKGKEIPCYINDEQNESLQYIEFYAEKNDGWFDLEMYVDPAGQTNPNFSMITDYSSVFLTWNNSFSNKRYVESNDLNFDGYTPLSYCRIDTLQEYIWANTGTYRSGPNPVDFEYTRAEGFYDQVQIGVNASVSKVLGTPNLYTNGTQASVDLAYITYSNGAYNITVDGPGMAMDTSFTKQQTIKYSTSFAASQLAESNSFTISNNQVAGTSVAYAQASFIKINYPSTFNFENYHTRIFELADASANKQMIRFIGLSGGDDPLLYDVVNGYKIKTSSTGTAYEAIIPATTAASKMVLLNAEKVLKVAGIEAAPMTDFSKGNNDFIILSHSKLIAEAQNYATYRNAYLVNVEELYDQFGYGIQKHPLAIRKFLQYAQNNWLLTPEYLFIIGKGIATKESRFSSTNFSNNLVPPMGDPASDILLSARLDGSSLISTIKTGRYSAQTAQEVSDYLLKVQEFEANPPSEWMKQGIHFGGGGNANEQALFSNYLKIYENYFTDTLFGGYISTFLKASSDPITITKSDSVKNLINNGISIMTFFGHGSTNGFDQNIDKPEAYENRGKYPLMIANSCYSGNIFLAGKQSQSEDWVMIAEKGTIGFLAMVYEGIAYYLNLFSKDFYQRLSNADYQESLGQVINNTRHYIEDISDQGTYKSTILGFLLHGDPSIVLNSWPKPDLLLDEAKVYFDPQNLTTEIDSFDVVIAATNIARSTSSMFGITVNRAFSDGSTFDTVVYMEGIKYRDTLFVTLPIDRVKGIGANAFRVKLDTYNAIDELDESNNETYVSQFITSSDIFPTVPYDESVVSEQSPVLKFSTGDPFSVEQMSVFEIDTTHFFNSPFKFREEVQHTGGVIEWRPSVRFSNNTTYFWRGAKKTAKEEDLNWLTFSFKTNTNNKGWQQDKPGQWLANSKKFITLDEITGEFSYETAPVNLTVNTYGTGNFPGYAHVGFSVGNVSDNNSCNGNKLLLVVIDSTTLIPWLSEKGDYQQENYPKCFSRSRPDNYYVYGNSSASVDNLINFVNNEVPDGHYIVVYNAGDGGFSYWSESNRQGFETWYPNSRVRFVSSGEPYVLFFKKGDLLSPIELTGSSTDALVLDEDLKTSFDYGSIQTGLIGPSKEWKNLELLVERSDITDESSYVQLMGVSVDKTETLLYDTIVSESLDISTIDANDYPWLCLRFISNNPISKVPNQLLRWQINYTPFSDLAVNAQRGSTFHADTLQQGELGSFTIAYENIGYEAMDSIKVTYWIQDDKNKNTPIKEAFLPPLKPGEYAFDSAEFNTLTQQDVNLIWVEFNPSVPNTNYYDQSEQNHFNNLAHKRYVIRKDGTNPILDLTFDGVHIMDGDIVSANPEIVIQLKDENQFIPLDDTTLFSVYIKNKQTGIEELINLSNNPAVNFIAAKLPENNAQLLLQQEFPEDGKYEIRVQAIDQTGNESGAYDYLISFEVINESTITNVFNYPNPFSTSTRFVFELTGSEIPEEMRIDILTVTGKVVQVIYMEDLGPINIGRNITEYAWDGRDMYGDPLANGVYFYRVFARINGEEIKIRNSGTSQYFKNGFGKMYLMR